MQDFSLLFIRMEVQNEFNANNVHTQTGLTHLDFGGFNNFFFYLICDSVHTLITDFVSSFTWVFGSHGILYVTTHLHSHTQAIWLHCCKQKGSDLQSIPAETVPTHPECV